MLAAEITAPTNTRLIETEVPTPGPRDVLIRVHRAGICGTDLHILHGVYQATYPLVPGHEFSGVVEAVGDEVKYFAAGDRVTADPNIFCGRCENCQRGQPNQCLDWRGIGITRPGGFAEYVSVPDDNVFPIHDLPFEQAAFIEPLACVVWGIQVVRPQVGDRALVFGAGPMGCLVMQNLKAAGVTEVTMVDRVDGRLATAAALGADRTVHADEVTPEAMRRIAPLGFEVVVDATGIPAVIDQTFAYARARGTVWLFGVAPTDATAHFNPYEVFRRDLRIVGSYAVNKTFFESIALLRSGQVRVAPLLSHSLPLADFQEGMRIAEHDPGRMKVQFALE